jgi:hypothetical protein
VSSSVMTRLVRVDAEAVGDDLAHTVAWPRPWVEPMRTAIMASTRSRWRPPNSRLRQLLARCSAVFASQMAHIRDRRLDHGQPDPEEPPSSRPAPARQAAPVARARASSRQASSHRSRGLPEGVDRERIRLRRFRRANSAGSSPSLRRDRHCLLERDRAGATGQPIEASRAAVVITTRLRISDADAVGARSEPCIR